MTARNTSLDDFWRQGLLYDGDPASAQHITKAIVRPRLVDSIDLHGAGLIRSGFREAAIPADELFFVHARDYLVLLFFSLGIFLISLKFSIYLCSELGIKKNIKK
jgi:hypothetical protein